MVFVETETGVPLYHNLQKGEIKNLLTADLAITYALESDNFEDAVRNAISLGNDADTLGAIAGPIAEALHGIPQDIKEEAESRYLANVPDIREVMWEMYQSVGE